MTAPTVARTIAEARAAIAALPRPVGLVPTMGAFHEGHLRLIRDARERCAGVVVSLFVNPTQFGPGEDYERYPRDEAHDLELAAAEGVDLVFAPAATEMYRDGNATSVHVAGALTEQFEGAARPGHFDGVATVVTKLFSILAPDVAFFGEKDAQQLALIRRFAGDLDLPVEIAGVPTVRESDGLAMSSRNAYLSATERAKAADLYRALLAGRDQAGFGRRAVITEIESKLVLGFPPYVHDTDETPEPFFSVDYVEIVDPRSFEPVDELTPDSLIIAAAHLRDTRLIDNLPLGDGSAAAGNDVPSHTEPDPSNGPASRKEG